MRQFLAHGYGATTIEEVAATARVAKRTIYTTIGDKSDLFVAVVRRLGDRAVDPTTADGRDAADSLHAFGVRLVRLMLSDEAVGLHRLVIAEATNFPDLAARLYTNGAQRYIGVLRDLLAELPDDQLLLPARATPDEHGRQAEALFTQLLGEWHRRRLFGLDPAPGDQEIDAHVSRTVRRFVR
ncbi:TetR family transcriptional regulator [Haloactinopolyspora alba]|uniref:TetR family transcriptional regulator n=2 Tax=Haloactinopolyspora alba TaxID=648780 RepID=A0A2P8E745_9ACTN|nr:TetR family transcriptional regulator [Haloactinopolyspora alba]